MADRIAHARQRRRWLWVLGALVLGIGLCGAPAASLGVAAPPYNTSTGGSSVGTPQCGYVAAVNFAVPQEPAQVAVFRAARVSCASARRVVTSCIGRRSVRGWSASRLNFTSTLTHGRQRIQVRLVSGPPPLCLQGSGLRLGFRTGQFGPGEGPLAYPDKWPAPYKIAYQWTTPVGSAYATIEPGSVSTVTLQGVGHNRDGRMRSFWFEYGKTRDLGLQTEKQNPRQTSDDAPVVFVASIPHLQAKTQYFWRAAASFDEADGGVKTVYGTLGSFVTNAYPKIKDPGRPCDSVPENLRTQPFELTESLAIVCNIPTPRTFSKGACFPACSDFYHGSIACPKLFPRNLNAGSWSITIPKIGYNLSINNLVSYWRSNDSNRFITWLPDRNANSPGGEVGPIPGWSDWDVAQWAYPFTSTSTETEFWINCTEKWGTVINADALAAGEGSDTASRVAPSEPRNVSATKASDGGIDVKYDAPASASPSGIAGYYVTVLAWKPGQPRAFREEAYTPITDTGLSGHVPPGLVDIVRKAAPAGSEITVVVGALSREGSISKPATAPLP